MNRKADLTLERNNPYDYIGARHNEGLNYIAMHYRGGGEEAVHKLINEYNALKNNGILTVFPYFTENNQKIKYQSKVNQLTTAKAYFDENKLEYNDLDRVYFFKMATIIDDFIEKHQDITKFKNLISKLEDQILNDKGDITKPLLLGTTSVAIHSTEYWFDYYTNPANLYRKIKPISEV